LISWFANQE